MTVYEAGTAYGTGATSLGTATANNKGKFTVTYTPPSSASAVVYVVALGGDAGSGTNSAIGLMGIAGLANALPATVKVNELTTVAGEWALAQFADATGQTMGASATNAGGIANAANQAQANLADIGSGGPAAFWATYNAKEATCTGGSPPVNCDGLERMDSLANILSACVESSGPASSACSTLLDDTGSGSTTLEAAHYMATNLTANIGDLFALQIESPPFTPALSSAPDGWEIALNLAPSGAKFNSPSGVAMDAAGNAWVTNNGANSVTALTSSGALDGYFNNTNTSGAKLNNPLGVAIDESGNVWVANNGGGSVTALASNGSLIGNYNNTNTTGAKLNNPLGIAIDAGGDAWVANNGGNSVTELTSGGALAGNFNNTNTSGAKFNSPYGLTIDDAGNVWVTNNGSSSVTALTSAGALAGQYTNANTSGAGFNGVQSLAIDAGGNVWIPNFNGDSVTALTSGGALVDNYDPTGANFNDPDGVAIDSAGNVWMVNSAGASLTELTSSGDLAGYFTPPGAAFSVPNGVAIDAAGDVWITNGGSNSVAEFIGAAGAVLTPQAACLTQISPAAVCLP